MLIGEAAFGFCEFPELSMYGFDRIGRVDGSADVVGIFEIR